jgi:hypothetical protein
VLSASKPYWQTVTCYPGTLLVEYFIREHPSIIQCFLLLFHASTFGVQMKIGQQSYILPPELDVHRHKQEGSGFITSWRDSRLFKWSLSFRITTKILYAILTSPFMLYVQSTSFSLTLSEYKLWSSSLCNFPQLPVTSYWYCYSSVVNKKVKLSMCLTTSALCHEDLWESGGIAQTFLTSALDGHEWSASYPGR